jgi:hypothetical protein
VSSTPPFLHLPFYPGIYCTTIHKQGAPGDVNHNRIPNQSVQDALNAEVNNLASRCYGIWATNPQTDTTGFSTPQNPMNNRFASGFQPDWDNRFAQWQQTVYVTFFDIEVHVDVPVRIWQYAMQSGAPQNFINLHVDFNETAPLDASNSPGSNTVNWMLEIS